MTLNFSTSLTGGGTQSLSIGGTSAGSSGENLNSAFSFGNVGNSGFNSGSSGFPFGSTSTSGFSSTYNPAADFSGFTSIPSPTGYTSGGWTAGSSQTFNFTPTSTGNNGSGSSSPTTWNMNAYSTGGDGGTFGTLGSGDGGLSQLLEQISSQTGEGDGLDLDDPSDYNDYSTINSSLNNIYGTNPTGSSNQANSIPSSILSGSNLEDLAGISLLASIPNSSTTSTGTTSTASSSSSSGTSGGLSSQMMSIMALFMAEAMKSKQSTSASTSGAQSLTQSTPQTAAQFKAWFAALAGQSNDGDSTSISLNDLKSRIAINGGPQNASFAAFLENNFNSISSNGSTITMNDVLNKAKLPNGQSLFTVTDDNASTDLPTTTSVMTQASFNSWLSAIANPNGGSSQIITPYDLAQRFMQGDASGGTTPTANFIEQNWTQISGGTGQVTASQVLAAKLPNGQPLIQIQG